MRRDAPHPPHRIVVKTRINSPAPYFPYRSSVIRYLALVDDRERVGAGEAVVLLALDFFAVQRAFSHAHRESLSFVRVVGRHHQRMSRFPILSQTGEMTKFFFALVAHGLQKNKKEKANNCTVRVYVSEFSNHIIQAITKTKQGKSRA